MRKSNGSAGSNRRDFVHRIGAVLALTPLAGCRALRSSRAPASAVGRLVVIDIPGPELDAETAAFIREQGVRAVLLFQRNLVDAEQTLRLTKALREVMGPEALIAVDQEGGAVIRTRDLPLPPSAMSIGATGDEALAYDVGRAVGRGLRSVGINWNFAPSLDVSSNPYNPVIGDRSFGSDPVEVARLGLAWALGCQGEGVATCLKHFPGHGDTQVDSHLGLPVVDKPRAMLEATELLPFRRAVEAGTPAVMTSHIVYRALDAERPATLSRRILADLLRRAWGYEGVVVTDAMNMRAIAERYGRGEAAVMALRAGADLVLAQGRREEQAETLEAIGEAMREGLLTLEDASIRTKRVDALASRFPASEAAYPAVQEEADRALSRRAWAAGLTAYGDPQPLRPGARVLLVAPSGSISGEIREHGFQSNLLLDALRLLYKLEVVTYEPANPADAIAGVAQARAAHGVVLLVTAARLRPGEGLRALFAVARPDLHLALWNPYAVLDVAAPALVTYGFRPDALEAVIAWLRGDIQAPGRLPIALS